MCKYVFICMWMAVVCMCTLTKHIIWHLSLYTTRVYMYIYLYVNINGSTHHHMTFQSHNTCVSMYLFVCEWQCACVAAQSANTPMHMCLWFLYVHEGCLCCEMSSMSACPSVCLCILHTSIEFDLLYWQNNCLSVSWLAACIYLCVRMCNCVCACWCAVGWGFW